MSLSRRWDLLEGAIKGWLKLAVFFQVSGRVVLVSIKRLRGVGDWFSG